MNRHLSLNNVSIGYGQKVVADGITATLEAGELVCLLGRNGIGKSTLLRTLAGFQPSLSGEIMIGEKPLSAFDRKELARTIGIVLTEQTDLNEMSVRELVSLGRSPYTGFFGNLTAEDYLIVDEAMKSVGITHLESRQVNTLSDGERQKAMIAKTLAQQTPVILLDEPTAFLDFQSRVELYQLLHRLAVDEQKVILMTTHDLQLALRLADRLWLFDEGLSVHQPPLSPEILSQFLGPDIAELLL